MLTASYVREILHYDRESGDLTWKQALSRRAKVGSIAGTRQKRGERIIMIAGRNHKAHRLAWLWMKGEWPPGQIDHRDRNPGNNAWKNLRKATRSQNGCNSIRQNKTGFKGVSFHKLSGRYKAEIRIDGKARSLGYFDNPEAAGMAYAVAAEQHHGEFARWY
jgi:hypothetical protein